MLTKEYGIFFHKYSILFCKYFHEHHAYDKNNAGYVNVGSFPQWIWRHCKLRKCVDEDLCANVQSLVTKQPILSQNQTQSKRKRPKFLIALGDFLYKV